MACLLRRSWDQRAGLEDEDLDFIGIEVPMHRRMLKERATELKTAFHMR